jgi:hypothetical protein
MATRRVKINVQLHINYFANAQHHSAIFVQVHNTRRTRARGSTSGQASPLNASAIALPSSPD